MRLFNTVENSRLVDDESSFCYDCGWSARIVRGILGWVRLGGGDGGVEVRWARGKGLDSDSTKRQGRVEFE
ncbi:hypothetical protein M0804_009165 [Polistes exclamans]|nr:hypothetical protein M0804_009165 [Polistes exclamans]